MIQKENGQINTDTTGILKRIIKDYRNILQQYELDISGLMMYPAGVLKWLWA